MIHADYLFLLTDVDGLYTSNPRKDPLAKPIQVVSSIAAIREEGAFFRGCGSRSEVNSNLSQSVRLPWGPVSALAEWKPS